MKKSTTKKTIGIAIIFIVILGGVLIIKKRQNNSDNAPKPQEYPMVVNTLKIGEYSKMLTLPYLALVQNENDITITAKTAARITYIKPIGTAVKAGEVVAKLDNTSFQTGLQSANAQLQGLKTNLNYLKTAHKRSLELYEIKGVSKEQLENELSKIADIESKISSLKQNRGDISNSFSYTSITAPYSGIVSKMILNEGDLAMPGQPIAKISAQSGAYLKINIPADLKIKGILYQNQFYKATPLNSTANGLAEYKVAVKNLNSLTDEKISIDIVLNTANGMVLPYDAILNREGKSYVFVVDKNKTKPVEVILKSTGENEVIINNNNNLNNQEIVVAKQDILLRLLGGVSIKINTKK
ncbi:MAG: hypothetical protein IE931_13015 [Sphingobacteriales bacterium]|nr:hypothetical protein [Sphingobacteriales bacterium]